MFTVEEINLMCIYDTDNKAALISGIYESFPYVYEPELCEIMEAVIEKLEKITDEDFSKIGFFVAGDYSEKMEG